jgi:hypothetical protein
VGSAAGTVVVVSLKGDKHAKRAIEDIRTEMLKPDEHLRETSFEAIVEAASGLPELAGWARAFRQRYVGLAPLA